MNEKKILLLGAGLVTGPLVKYLLDIPEFRLTVADLVVEKAEKVIDGHEHGTAAALDVSDETALETLIAGHDLCISLLPATMHPVAARYCLKHGKNLVTSSYVSDDMKAFDADAREKGLLFLNELGLDPGIDHMSAMRIIHSVADRGGKITSFKSYCGGLPAPEANTNPMGYKFSWAPRGVILASRNPAKFFWNNTLKQVPGVDLFTENHALSVGGMDFEAYPNRDSMPYQDLYNLADVHTMYRGTLRNPGWCKTMKTLVDYGYLDLEEKQFTSKTFADFFKELTGVSGKDVRTLAADKAGLPPDHYVLDRLAWLGLFSNDEVPAEKTALDVFAAKCFEKLQFEPGERDMVVLHHIFEAELEGETRIMTSTLIDHGIPGGESAMARTVSLPAAIGAKLIAQGKINLTGVHIPISREIYQPILDELEQLNIRSDEQGVD